MGKGKFVNQKLGKNVSRKFDLLKSELAGRANRKIVSRHSKSASYQKGNQPGQAIKSSAPAASLSFSLRS